jgi:accessory gene regulator protein AgrB
MDLDALKPGLNRRLEEEGPVHARSDFRTVTGHRSLLEKLRRNLGIELVLYLLCGIAFLLMAFVEEKKALSIYFGVFSVPMFLFVPVFHLLRQRISAHLHSAASIHASIFELLGVLKAYVRRYLQFNVIMVPVCVITVTFLIARFPHTEAARTEPLTGDASSRWLLFSLLLIIPTVIGYFISKAYVNWLYGNHIMELEKLLREFDDTQDVS